LVLLHFHDDQMSQKALFKKGTLLWPNDISRRTNYLLPLK
jgi:hypothetical protein